MNRILNRTWPPPGLRLQQLMQAIAEVQPDHIVKGTGQEPFALVDHQHPTRGQRHGNPHIQVPGQVQVERMLRQLVIGIQHYNERARTERQTGCHGPDLAVHDAVPLEAEPVAKTCDKRPDFRETDVV